MAKDLELFDNKIIVLYILEKNSKSLNIDQIAKFCEDFEDITYFDICAYVQELESNGYITENYGENGNISYSITSSGVSTLNELLELIPGVNLHNIKKVIQKNMEESKKDYSVDNVVIPTNNNEFKVSCYIKEGNEDRKSVV